MKNNLLILTLGFLFIFSCGEDNDDNINGNNDINTTFNFTHNWDGTNISSADFNTIQYTNANGEQLSIERLRYLISDITFTKENGETIIINEYNLVDVTNSESMSFSPSLEIPTGVYTNVSFTFGFDNEDNVDGAYTDLNSASWNVPMMLGGGYHYMQLEGKFIDNTASETGYAYHTIRAVDISDPNEVLFQDTFIDVNIGPITITNDIAFEIKMNISEWFKNPNQWDLNDLHSTLMPNFVAQIMMHENGQSVFSLGNVTQ